MIKKQIKSIFFISIIVLMTIYPFIVLADNNRDRGKGKKLGHSKEQKISQMYLFSDSVEWGVYGIRDVLVDIYADGVFQEALMTNGSGNLANFNMVDGVGYTFNITYFGISSYISGDIVLGVMNIELPTFSVDIQFYYSGGSIVASFQTVTIRMAYSGLVPDLVLVTDALGQVTITEHMFDGWLVLTSDSGIISYDQNSAQAQSEKIHIDSEILKVFPFPSAYFE